MTGEAVEENAKMGVVDKLQQHKNTNGWEVQVTELRIFVASLSDGDSVTDYLTRKGAPGATSGVCFAPLDPAGSV
jgi:hypothetical protein